MEKKICPECGLEEGEEHEDHKPWCSIGIAKYGQLWADTEKEVREKWDGELDKIKEAFKDDRAKNN